MVAGSAQLVSAMLPDPALRRLATLLDGFAAELSASCPGSALDRVPARRWADLWSRAILLTLPGAAGAPGTSAAETATGRLLPLGIDLQEHPTAVQAQVHAVFEPADGTASRLVRASVSAPKPDTVIGAGLWQLLRPHMSLLAACGEGRAMNLTDMPVTAEGDLIWSNDHARLGEPADPFVTARVALPAATDPATAPLDRHPARIAVPVFLEGYAAKKSDGALAFVVTGHPLAVDTDRVPVAGPLTPQAVAASGACIGLLRWDGGSFSVQPLAVEATVRKKAVARPRRRMGRGHDRPRRREGRECRDRRHRGAVRARRKAAAQMTEMTETSPEDSASPENRADDNRRQVLYWRLLARLFDPEEQANLESASVAVVADIGLPAALLDPYASVDSIVQRHPGLAAEFDGLMTPEPDPDGARDRAAEVRRAALVSKVLLNVFATGAGTVTAGQLARWQADAGWLERALGARPGELRGGRPGKAVPAQATGPAAAGTTPDLSQLIPAIGPELSELEADLVKRMHLREVLADPLLAAQLTPSMSLIEQLLQDKGNLSGVALANAKSLIRRFVDEVAEVLRTEVEKSSVGAVDRSVPPKRVFRNLDLDRTIWKNLTNWSPEEERLYVDRLYYRHTARKTTPQRLIVVVDQSGSMTDSMVNCTILASIFAGLPKVDVHLIAYDTQALDLTPWVHDPFETLLRTNLGGGNDGLVAMALAQPKIAEPRSTVVVWISDFYETRVEQLFESMAAIHRSGARFIPVGSVTSSGRGSVNPWFRERFKDLGTPVISGHIRKLVHELKTFLT